MTGSPPIRGFRLRAVTLLEVILAMGLLTMLTSSLYFFYGSSIDTRERSLAITRRTQLVRVLLTRMAEEIRQASGFVEGYGAGLVGFPHAISVNTLTLPDRILSQQRDVSLDQLPGQFDLREVSYYLAIDEENLDDEGLARMLGMVRKEEKTYNRVVVIQGEEEGEAEETLAVKEELYAPEIKFLEFRYFDGAAWWHTWELERGNSLPQMVRITIGFTPDPDTLDGEEDAIELIEEIFESDEDDVEPMPADRFAIFVRLVQGDTFFGSRVSRAAASFAASSAR